MYLTIDGFSFSFCHITLLQLLVFFFLVLSFYVIVVNIFYDFSSSSKFNMSTLLDTSRFLSFIILQWYNWLDLKCNSYPIYNNCFPSLSFHWSCSRRCMILFQFQIYVTCNYFCVWWSLVSTIFQFVLPSLLEFQTIIIVQLW